MTSAVVYDYDDSFGANFVNTKSVPQLQNYPTLGSEGKAVYVRECVCVCLTERERDRERDRERQREREREATKLTFMPLSCQTKYIDLL